jgi:myo-inositol-1(or 4)-monophosphatase
MPDTVPAPAGPMPDAAIAARFDFALALVREAGDHAASFLADRAGLEVRNKGHQDIASAADLGTEVLIRERLAARHPEDGFLGEETGASEIDPAAGTWVVDPIDGTQPYVSGLSSWCVSIAYVKGGRLLFGMVYAPGRDELFAGGIGFPATLNGGAVARHPARSIREGITGVGYSPRVAPEAFLPVMTRFLERGGMFYRDGSGALTLCYVAAGRLIGYIEPHINSWDCLGALAVIEAAGLRTSDFLEGDGLLKGNHLIVGNDPVYAELEEILGG